MKNFKKFAAVLLASVMTLAALCMPIAAATLDDMSFTPPAGWSDPQGVNRWFEKGEDEIFLEHRGTVLLCPSVWRSLI